MNYGMIPYEKAKKEDYAGLTELAELFDREGLTTLAEEIVADVEKNSAENVADLWEKINKANKWALKIAFESGLLTKDRYESVRDQFENYVPLRGHLKEVAADRYFYMEGKPSSFSPLVIKARGRKSLADSPFSYMMSMTEGALHKPIKIR